MPASGDRIKCWRAPAAAKLGEIGPIPTYSRQDEGVGMPRRPTLRDPITAETDRIIPPHEPPGEHQGRSVVPALLPSTL